jgi:hAT family C-terminal dimerisation region
MSLLLEKSGHRSFQLSSIFCLAMTVLAIPATSVPSERVSSSSAQTDTPRRNRLSPAMMEALQVLRFNHQNGVIDFTAGSVDNAEDLDAITYDEMFDRDLEDDFRRAQGHT